MIQKTPPDAILERGEKMLEIEFKIKGERYKLWRDECKNFCFGQFVCVHKQTGHDRFDAIGYYTTLENAIKAIFDYKLYKNDIKSFKEMLKAYTATKKWVEKTFGVFDVKVSTNVK